MADNYREYFNKQLKSKEDTFDFAQTMFQQVNNDYWREKSNLWHIISAACNDAAGEFYVKLKEENGIYSHMISMQMQSDNWKLA